MISFGPSVLTKIIGVLVLALALSGCFGAYQTAPDTPLGAGGLAPTQEDPDAGQVAVAPGVRLKDYSVVLVERFPVSKSEIKDEEDQRFADAMATFYQSELVRRLRESGLFSRVVNLTEAEFSPGPDRALRLRGNITRLGRGSQAVRYLVGFGAGSTRAQAEMHFVDIQSGRVVVVTADRRLGSMGLFGGDSEDFLRESFDDMARDLVKFLVRLSRDGVLVAGNIGSTPPGHASATATSVPQADGARQGTALLGTWEGRFFITVTSPRELVGTSSMASAANFWDARLTVSQSGTAYRWTLTGDRNGERLRADGTIELVRDRLTLRGAFDRHSGTLSNLTVDYRVAVDDDELTASGVSNDNRVHRLALRRSGR